MALFTRFRIINLIHSAYLNAFNKMLLLKKIGTFYISYFFTVENSFQASAINSWVVSSYLNYCPAIPFYIHMAANTQSVIHFYHSVKGRSIRDL